MKYSVGLQDLDELELDDLELELELLELDDLELELDELELEEIELELDERELELELEEGTSTVSPHVVAPNQSQYESTS